MTVFPIIIDSRPPYLGEHGPCLSLGCMPYGPVTILDHLAETLFLTLRRKARVVRTFETSADYEMGLAKHPRVNSPSQNLDEFVTALGSYEPSDWLLFVDPRCFPGSAFDVAPLLSGLAETPRIARHLIALEGNAGGTNERVEFDANGRVRRVQRYYDTLTWTVAAGVSASLVPVSSLHLLGGITFGSLLELRQLLSSYAVPSRDVPLSGLSFDLGKPGGLMRLNEVVLEPTPKPDAGFHVKDARRSRPTARNVKLLGAVALHPTAVVEEDVTLIGPTAVGAMAHLERGAIIAQSVVGRGVRISGGCVVRHRVATGSPQVVMGTEMAVSSSGDDGRSYDEGPRHLHEDRPSPRLYSTVKMVIEGVIAAVALLMLSPLLLLIAILIKLESRGPVFFGDPREAKDGKVFRCYKFRTMFVGADVAQRDLMSDNQVDGPQFKLKHDPRVTRLGRWLRMISLDELPQLFNVAVGQMSLVGPRPSPFRENQTCVPWRDARLSVRPGITGLWQVCRHDRDSGDFHQWIYYDMLYVRHMSFWVDMKILAATVITLGGKGHVPLSWIISSPPKKWETAIIVAPTRSHAD